MQRYLIAAGLLLGCATESPWLRPQRELLAMAKQADAAIDLASDVRTRAALQLCAVSAAQGVERIKLLMQQQEKLRQSKRQGVAVPELERQVAIATSEAEDAEATARKDCSMVKVVQPQLAAHDAGADATVRSEDMTRPTDLAGRD